MSTLVVDYAFNSTQLANPDGSLAATSTGCTAVTGPGAVTLGTYASALSFGTAGKLQVNLPLAQLSAKQFTVRTVIKADAAVTGRQDLVNTAAVPLSLYLDSIAGSSDYKAVVSVSPKDYGWATASTEYSFKLKVGTWYTIDLIYDTDTLGVAINGVVQGVVAFPVGTITAGTAPALFVGTWTDGTKNHFSGSMAALQVINGVPTDLEAALDEQRNSPEWFITYKYEKLKATLNLGNASGEIAFDTSIGAYTQLYSGGLLMFAESVGAAFEMHGAIFEAYQKLSTKADLGYLVSDEADAEVSGARKNTFSAGAMYWSGGTGAVPVTGRIYVDYENMGGAKEIGLPTAAATAIANGKEQVFQGAHMYLKTDGERAFEVQGVILAKFQATGGVGKWGYPISNEHDLLADKKSIGRASEFEGCTFYWSGATGAYEVNGEILTTYLSLNGPAGELGFPTSDEEDIPGASGSARANTFQKGSLTWFGSEVIVCRPYHIFVGTFNTKNSEGFGMGQNDLYFRITVNDNGHPLLNIKYPQNDTAYGGHDILQFDTTLPIAITPNVLSSVITITFDIWESDSGAPFGGGDDYMGTWTGVLNAANAWGMRTNNGVMNTGPFNMVNSLTWAVQPIVNIAALSKAEKWWGVQNQHTDDLTYHQYGAAFYDVDVTPGFSDPQNWLADGLEGIFYLAVVKTLAANGNCFGMSLEAIYSLKSRSLLSMPINRFTDANKDWNVCVDTFNVRHEYQVGRGALWWFVGQFLSGETHDPVGVFNTTWDRFSRGDNPVICISQNWDFSGAGHCLMPISWDKSSKPWKLELADPNWPSGANGLPDHPRYLLVDPDKNTFSYDGGEHQYAGGDWSGGRFYYFPYSQLCDQPRTPVWDILALLVFGAIVILGSDAETSSLTDENGTDLSAFSADATAKLKAKQPLDHKFVPIKGFNGGGSIASEVLFRKAPKTAYVAAKAGLLDNRVGANVKIGELAKTGALPTLAADAKKLEPLAARDVKSVVNDAKTMATLDAPTAAALRGAATLRGAGTGIRHKVKGTKANAQLQYLVKNGLNEIRVGAPLALNEEVSLSFDDLGTPSSVVTLETGAAKAATIRVVNQLGVGKDSIELAFENLLADKASPLKVNVKPGLGGIDILSQAPTSKVGLTVTTTVAGKATTYAYELPFAGSMRIRTSTILSDQSLKVSKISSLFAPILDSTLVKPKA